MSISRKVKDAGLDNTSPRGPVWLGPEDDGITFSMLSNFIVCRERFRLKFVEGLQPPAQFNHRMEYGNMFHTCEEFNNAGESWEESLTSYCKLLGAMYPTAGEQINHWRRVCKAQFPVYCAYWDKSKASLAAYKSLTSEEVFDVPYQLPSGRNIRLRGKWDGLVYEKHGKLWLQENKTKGDIQPEQLRKQLTFDLQTMLYMVALETWKAKDSYGIPIRTPQIVDTPTVGIIYNVVRRPLSGGRHSIKQLKTESTNDYYLRLQQCIEGEPEYFFMRWQVPVSKQDIETFKRTCLNPILEQLCDWYLYLTAKEDPFRHVSHMPDVHWRHPYGVYNVLDEGGSTEYDAYLYDGNPTGLHRITNDDLFPELK